MSVIINDARLVFRGTQRRRSNTSVIVVHHTGTTASQSVRDIHNYYLARKDPDGSTYIGIAYHYYIRKDGTVWRGREERTVGGHAGAEANPISIGICFEGNFEEETMSEKQLDAGAELIKDILTRYPGLEIKKHKEYFATACPGRNFPFDKLAAEAKKTKSTFPGAQHFGPGKSNEYILALDRALISRGYAKYYKYGENGASRDWGNGTYKAVKAFQRAQGWKGRDADGIPGPVTWARLGL
jgi:N-acetylmuramoyl-L-alanine amidase